MAGILFIISAPSGSGKSTLVNQLRSLLDGIEFSVSYTTRRPRGAERDGVDYEFTTRENFERMIAEGQFLEHAEVFGNYYGTSCESLEKARLRGKDLILDIDVQGAAQVREKMPDAISIFVMPPTREVLARRLENRSRAEGIVNPETMHRRLAEARSEIENYRQYRYILVNDVLDRAVAELAAIVLSERVVHSGGPFDVDAKRQIDMAAGCLQANAIAGMRPVLESFGLGNSPEQGTIPFGQVMNGK